MAYNITIESPEEKIGGTPEEKNEKVPAYQLICAWCGKLIEEKEGSLGRGEKISHGICPECRKEQSPEKK